MADRRKLQKEIDMCIKKVQEGVEEFDDVFDKLQSSSNQNQKEKKEEELKKVIKKLQRQRDQIKAWQQSNEVKDKSNLLKYRQLIERQMERFKIIERETKTKAYSKEGLSGISTKVDPAQREKDDCRTWLHETIEKLQQQNEQFEATIDQVNSGKKKKLSRADQDTVDEMEQRLTRHQYYITNLETLMRLLDNDQMTPDKINDIRDHIEYYVENNDEDESLINDDPSDLFSDFNLEEVQGALGIAPVVQDTIEDKSSTKSENYSEKDYSSVEKSSSRTNTGSVVSTFDIEKDEIEHPPVTPKEKEISHEETTTDRKRNKSSGGVSDIKTESADSPRRLVSRPTSSFPGLPAPTSAKKTDPPPNFAKAAAGSVGSNDSRKTNSSPSLGVWGPSDKAEEEPSSAPLLSSVMPPSSVESIVDEPKVIKPPPNLQPPSPSTYEPIQQTHVQEISTIDPLPPNGFLDPDLIKEKRIGEPTKECNLSDLIGPNPVTTQQVQEQDQNRYAVEAAFKHMPQLSDSEKPRIYLYRQPTPYCPSYYPKTCLSDMHTPDFFMKLPQETLFYIFYYMEGTRAQYLAAVTLKKQSWRFHTKYMMWFQRHEEPKTINDEYEQGTYIYFDYERWAQRRKEGFTFEYRYLEDRELPLNN